MLYICIYYISLYAPIISLNIRIYTIESPEGENDCYSIDHNHVCICAHICVRMCVHVCAWICMCSNMYSWWVILSSYPDSPRGPLSALMINGPSLSEHFSGCVIRYIVLCIFRDSMRGCLSLTV